MIEILSFFIGYIIGCIIYLYLDLQGINIYSIKWFFTPKSIKKIKQENEEKIKIMQGLIFLNEPCQDMTTNKITSLWKIGCREYSGIKFKEKIEEEIKR